MNVLVATCATQLIEVIERNCRPRQRLMAVVASNRHVAARQGETRRLMFGNREVRSLERSSVVTLFAAILPGGTSELALVFIFVAIYAFREFDLVARFLAGR